jgi:putative ABC transport system permease protein
MFKNYFKTALRNLLKNKIFSFINIFGLAIGLACCILMFLFISSELSYDKFIVHSGNIYRVTSIADGPSGKTDLAVTPSPWAPLMQQDYPEIKSYVRLFKDEKSLVGQPGEEHNYEKDFLFCDSTFFDVFSFNLLKGDPHHALDAPNSIILTKETAAKYFGKNDPIGKPLEITTSFGRVFTLQVTGIADNPPVNAHFSFTALISMQTIGDISNFWSFHMFHTYALLNDGVSANALENKFKRFSEKYINNNPNADGKQEIHLQPITDIHLHSQMTGEIGTNGDITYVYVFSGIALFVLLIACFNFMNLSTVRSLQRAKEVGLRKVVGAERKQLIKQFLGESTLVSVVALILSLVITVLVLPLFNQLSERSLRLNLSNNHYLILLLALLVFFVGIVSGIYPAFVLSSFKPVEVLKGRFIKSFKGDMLRKALVSFQFIISIALIAATMIVYRQLQFLQTKNPGFNKDQVLLVTLPKNSDAKKLEAFKTSLLNNSNVISVAATSTLPGVKIPVNQVHSENDDPDKNASMQMLFVDEDFIKTMQMKVVAGRDFSKKYATDENEGFILNEEAIKQSGWKTPGDAIGKTFEWVLPDKVLKSGNIIGVVKDFNITPLKTAVQSLVMHIAPDRFQYLYVRYNKLTASNAISMAEKKFKEFYTTQPFEYNFLDDTLNSMYKSETRLGEILEYFSALAILIASLGIVGLSIYSIQQRTKEIGIRKVLGANTTDVVAELSKNFLRPVFIAAIIATPVAWWTMNNWLQGFAYRIGISWWIFFAAGLLAVLIALITVSFQSIKAAIANPVKSLRTE